VDEPGDVECSRHAPRAGASVTVGSGHSVTLDDATADLASFMIANGGTLTVSGWSSALRATNLLIAGTVTHSPNLTATTNSLGLWVPEHRILIQGSNLAVAATGKIDANYMGYRPGVGPGRGIVGGYGNVGGGGYGGCGGDGFGGSQGGTVYGAPDDPWQPGSGGGYTVNSRPAGGAIRIELAGRASITGLVTACGQDAPTATHGCSGSGGGIAIYCDTLEGAAGGLVRADGGRGYWQGGNGGGGRIALHYNPASQAALDNPRPPLRFSAHAWRTAVGDQSFTVKAQMGTLYMPDMTLLTGNATGPAVLDGQRFWHTRLHIGETFEAWSPQSLSISNCVVDFPDGFTLEVAGDLTLAGTLAPLVGDVNVRAGLALHAVATNELYGARLVVGGDLAIGYRTWIYPHTQGYSAAIVGMKVWGDVTIAAGGGIDADEKGYMPQSDNMNGPGAGKSNTSGGGYGGAGGGGKASATYGLEALPLEPGSPGGWRWYTAGTPTGRGGGAIHLIAGGELSIDGLLTANGGNGWFYVGPGGSGGSVFLAGRRIRGIGEIRAKGGTSTYDSTLKGYMGPGGGGRIAVWRQVPLAKVEQRIAARDTRGLARSGAHRPFAEGKLLADVTPSALAFQPQPGTTGFYTFRGTTLLLR
jgi:hypothetical protein